MKLGLSDDEMNMKLGLGMTENEMNSGVVEEKNSLGLRKKSSSHTQYEMYEVTGETIEHLRSIAVEENEEFRLWSHHNICSFHRSRLSSLRLPLSP